MRKIFIFLIALSSSLFNLFPEVDYEDFFVGYTHFFLSDEVAFYENIAGMGVGDYTFPESLKIDRYQLVNDHGIPFIEGNGDSIFLILSNDELCYLYNKEALHNGILRPILVGLNTSNDSNIYLSSPRGSLEVSSFLTEGEIEYGVKNLKSIYLDKPWVEGVSGQGIGEEITIELVMNIDPALISRSGS